MQRANESWDVVVLGAGASGLVCALGCAGRGRRVAVVDHAAQAARKVSISGGGRCNLTNLRASAEHYVCGNPHFVKSALARFGPGQVLEFMAGLGLAGVEEAGGRVFCAQGAEAVAEALASRAASQGAELLLGRGVIRVERREPGFLVQLEGEALACGSLVVALGGLAWPQAGATNLGHAIARSMGLLVTPLRPGLVPLLAPAELLPLCRSLAGVSLPVRIDLDRVLVEGDLLFTHRGISGPAVLDASLYWRPGSVLSIDLLPRLDLAQALANAPRLEIHNALARLLPRRLAGRLAEALCQGHGFGGRVGDMPARAVTALEALAHAWPFAPVDSEGFARAEVTLGGVDTGQVSSKTMEAKAVPGLYFTGEVLDVTGRLGGFNLQWAWSSGHAAGLFA